MNFIKVSLDREMFDKKPVTPEIVAINKRIGGFVEKINPTPRDIRTLAEKISIDGQTFCPATFKDGIRNQAHFEQQQFIALD
ncbi:MAG: hypothetical protein K2P41_15970, partial [Lachnospiraceae bacterium]|nr:hypothetical protein [Lachnospiraceae bacterium]